MPASWVMRSWVCLRVTVAHFAGNARCQRIICELELTLLYLDMKLRANVAVELRDNIEPLCSPATYSVFLSKLWPVFKNILSGEPVFTNASLVQVSCEDVIRS
jgi:hypothetical protein